MSVFETVPMERVRAYWDARPCNIRHSPKTVGTREYFDEVEKRKYHVEPHIPAFAEFSRWNDKKVLEIGCGIGTDTINFARAGAHVTAVDLSAKSLEIARQRADIFGVSSQIHFHCADAEELSSTVPAETYDLIYAFGVIHHSAHPDRILAQLRRYCKGDTVLKLMVYYRYSWKVAGIVLRTGRGKFWQLDRMVAQNSEAQSGCPVTYSYSRRAARQMIEQHGFRVTDAQVDHIFPYRIPDYVQYHYVKEWYFAMLPEPLFRHLERFAGWHLLVNARVA